MAPTGDDKRPQRAAPERSVLSSLPSTRPQRPSARRAAERSKPTKPKAPPKRTATTTGRASAARTASRSGPAPKRSDPAAREPTTRQPATRGPAAREPTTRQPATRGPAARRPPIRDPDARARPHARTRTQRHPQEPPIPRQGFETEEEIAPGSTVEPPSRPELAAAVADLLGELAQGGLTAGGRLLKEVLGRLPGA